MCDRKIPPKVERFTIWWYNQTYYCATETLPLIIQQNKRLEMVEIKRCRWACMLIHEKRRREEWRNTRYDEGRKKERHEMPRDAQEPGRDGWSCEATRTRTCGTKGNGIDAPRKQKVRETKKKVAGLCGWWYAKCLSCGRRHVWRGQLEEDGVCYIAPTCMDVGIASRRRNSHWKPTVSQFHTLLLRCFQYDSLLRSIGRTSTTSSWQECSQMFQCFYF